MSEETVVIRGIVVDYRERWIKTTDTWHYMAKVQEPDKKAPSRVLLDVRTPPVVHDHEEYEFVCTPC